MGEQPTDLPDGNLSVRLISTDQTFLGAFLEFFDQPFLTQGFAFIAAGFGVDQRHGGAGKEEACALAALMRGKTAHRVVADPAVKRPVGRPHKVDEPGFAHRSFRDGRDFAVGAHVTIKA